MPLSMERWIGKVAIVTGASSGIGAAISGQLVKEGLQVVGLARNQSKVLELAENLENGRGKLYALKCDITKEQDILNAFKWTIENLGPIHVLVNNAGTTCPSSVHAGKTEEWKLILDTNILGLSIATREAIKNMRENGVDGHIIHINSICGHYINEMPNHMYYASKYGVTALTEALRRELVKLESKIRVTSVSPGVTKTAIFERGEAAEFLAANPYLNPSDIADAIVYILSTPPHVQVHELMIRPVGEVL